MQINNNIFDEKGKSFQEIMEQFLIIYYNELVVESA